MNAPRRVAPEAPARRGWCPSLARPMPTGDGLLARIHPPLGRLTPAQARAVAAGARRFGNGHVDVTARANLQVRGVTEATRRGLAEALAAAGLGDTRGDGGPQRLTLTTPLAGLEPGGVDVPALAARVEAIGLTIPGLPPKTLVAVEADTDGIRLGPAQADAHLVADARGVMLHLAGDAAWWRVSRADVGSVVEAVLRLLAASGQRRMRDLTAEARGRVVDRLGLRPATTPVETALPQPGLLPLNAPRHTSSGWRGSPLLEGEGQGEVRDLSGDGAHLSPTLSLETTGVTHVAGSAGLLSSEETDRMRCVAFPAMDHTSPQPSPSRRGSPLDALPAHPNDPGHAAADGDRRRSGCIDPMAVQERDRAGPGRSGDTRVALLVDAPFGRCTADALEALAEAADALGAEDLRLSPTRGFLLVAADAEAAGTAKDTLAAAGFLTRADDPRGAVAACPGAPACASGSTPTLADAARLADAFRPFAERGLRAHVSGCSKGCAHPGAADLTLVGRDGAYDVVLNGRPDALPATRLPFEAALERVRRADSAASLSAIFTEHPPGLHPPGPRAP